MFNHDWLKNVYLPALDSWVNILDGEIEDSEFETRFLDGRFREWANQRSEARTLLEQFEEEMSPANLLDRWPLVRLSDRHRRWLSSVIHVAWKARTGHGPVLQDIEASLDAANAVFDKLSEELRGVHRASTTDLGSFRDRFADLASHCRDLGHALSRLPSAVRIA